MAIIFIGTPAFAVPSLQRLAADGHYIAAVITQPDRPAGRGRQPRPSAVKLAALGLGLPILQPESLRDPATLDHVRALAPECAVAVAYGQILRKDFLDIPPRGVVNVHPSLLPKYRGASPIPAAILAGDDLTGVTIMLMDPGMDSGPVLAQRTLPIDPEDTAATLSDKLARAGADLLAETLPRWLRGEIEPSPQDESQATKTSLLRKEDGAIDWSRPAVHVWRQVRACSPWPGAFTHLGDETIHIWRAWPLTVPPAGEPGTIISLTPEQRAAVADAPPFAVQTGDGLLAVREAQRAGRRPLLAAEFLRGMPGLIGKRLR
ncbi:MAG TPA: methionyl-tRNA formyltransferase [Dehalococcoidia bacterium]|nr:methionyl-tRNA formyltransferase [Dehalococcoidia bacterium]